MRSFPSAAARLLAVLAAIAIALGAACAFPRAARARDDAALAITAASVSDAARTAALSATPVPLDRIVPMSIDVTCDPALIETGVDCGMPEMCGIDPCLCGAVDAYGACACSGTRVATPALSVTSSDETVVKVVCAFGRTWLVPVGAGSATVAVTGTLAHYEDGSAAYEVEVGALQAMDAVAICVAVAVAVLLFASIRWLVKRMKSKHLCLILAILFACLLTGCGQAKVGDTSPAVADVSFGAVDATSEASQRFDVTLTFDRPIKVDGDVLDGLDIQVNGTTPADTVAVGYRCAADSLTITFGPSASASTAGSTGSFFALYQGQIEISAKASDGALPGVTGADGVAALLSEPVSLVVPSGLAFEVVASEGASETVRITRVPKLRVITWLSPDGGETVLLKHNHLFLDATPASCAADIASVINAAACGYTAMATGDTVTITSQDGSTPDFELSEGLGAAIGAATADELMETQS